MWVCESCKKEFEKPEIEQEACDCCTGISVCPYCYSWNIEIKQPEPNPD